MEINAITEKIIGAAISVHRELGPGLLESTYQACIAYELVKAGLSIERQKPVSVTYKGEPIDCGFRVDFLVERAVIVEIKVVERLEPIHTAQVLTYLRLSDCHVGLLINFNVQFLRDGIRRLVHALPE